MKKIHGMIVILATLILSMGFCTTVFAKDVGDYFDTAKKISPGKEISGTFEKSSDADCYSFVSGGGKYKLYIYTRKALNSKQLPLSLSYGGFQKFSAAAGAPPVYQIGAIHGTDYLYGTKTTDGWYVKKVSIGKYKKGQTAAFRLEAMKTGKYKFRLVGNLKSGGSTKTDIAAASVKVSSVTYNGKSREPSVTVKYSGKTLKKGTDYKIAGWKNNKNAGTASVTLTGKGKYHGTVIANFTIKKASITLKASPASIKKNYSDIGSKITIKPAASKKSTFKYSSSDSKVVTVTSSGVAAIKGSGSAKITVTATPADKNYAKKSVTVKVTVTAKPKEKRDIQLDAVYDTDNGWYIAPYSVYDQKAYGIGIYELKPNIPNVYDAEYSIVGGTVAKFDEYTPNRLNISDNGLVTVRIHTKEDAEYAATDKEFKLWCAGYQFPNNEHSALSQIPELEEFNSLRASIGDPHLEGVGITARVPQGVCATEDYLLVTCYNAFSGKPVSNSEILVLDRDWGSFITSFELKCDNGSSITYNSYSHLGGIAYDPDDHMIYIADSEEYEDPATGTPSANVIWSLSEEKLEQIIENRDKVAVANKAFESDVKASCLTYYNKRLYVAQFSEKETNSRMQVFRKSGSSFAVCDEFRVPVKTQGVAFHTRGNETWALFSTSYGRENRSSLEIRKVMMAEDGSINDIATTGSSLKMPNMSEGICISDDGYGYDYYAVIAFESGAYKYSRECYRKMDPARLPVDRLIAISLNQLLPEPDEEDW